jgi:hypothetical protein
MGLFGNIKNLFKKEKKEDDIKYMKKGLANQEKILYQN